MATIIELTDSRQITVSEENPRVELMYVVHGTEDEQAARLMVESTLPAFYVITHAPAPITTVFQSYDVKHQGGGLWDVRATYGRRTPSKAGQVVLNFDTGGGTTHIQNSLRTSRSYYRDPVTNNIVDAPDQKGAINFDGKRVAGVDIGIGVYKWSETWNIAKPLLTSAYRKKLKTATKTWNQYDFREFKDGEVLFEGVSGVKDTNEDFSSLTFHFAQSDNAEVTVGDLLCAKDGWEYLWIRYRDGVDKNVGVQVPDAVYIEQVYEYSDFAELGIGILPLD